MKKPNNISLGFFYYEVIILVCYSTFPTENIPVLLSLPSPPRLSTIGIILLVLWTVGIFPNRVILLVPFKSLSKSALIVIFGAFVPTTALEGRLRVTSLNASTPGTKGSSMLLFFLVLPVWIEKSSVLLSYLPSIFVNLYPYRYSCRKL